MFSSSLLRLGQTITFWTLTRHIQQQKLYLREHTYAKRVGHGAVSVHRVGNDYQYALCGAAVYSVTTNGRNEVTCSFCKVLTP